MLTSVKYGSLGENTNIVGTQSQIVLFNKDPIKKEQPELDCMSPAEGDTSHNMSKELTSLYDIGNSFTEGKPQIMTLFIKEENQLEQNPYTPDVPSSCKSELHSNERMDVFFHKNENNQMKLCLKRNMKTEEKLEKLLHEEIDLKVEHVEEWVNRNDANSINVYETTSSLPRSANVGIDNKLDRGANCTTHFLKLNQPQIKHPVAKLFICNECDYTTGYSGNLKKHEMKHSGQKPYSCDLCDYKTTQKNQLKEHAMKHSGSKPFACDQCNYHGVSSRLLKLHQIKHLGEKSFSCDQCDYKTCYSGNLKKHQMKHSGEKPFACDQCCYKSVSSKHLKEHQMKHSGEKPFVCEQCDFTTFYSHALKRHQMKHLGEKPFACDMCHYKTLYSNDLKKHQKTHLKREIVYL